MFSGKAGEIPISALQLPDPLGIVLEGLVGEPPEENIGLAGWEGAGPGFRVAGYLIEERVGRGGMAMVFRARDERLGRLVALKVLAPVLAVDAGFRERFVRESRAAAAVDDPHIIPVFEAGEADGLLFIAMRYVAGGDVRSLLRRSGPLPAWRAAAILSPVASALDAAHAAGLVHRDVKPANMLVDARPGRPDHVYLSDFGLSKGALTSVGLTGSGLLLGTPDYISPEQIAGREVDGRADQYSLACTAFELLTGTPPFARDHGMAVIHAHAYDPPPLLTSRRPGSPPAADGILARGMAKDPADRYPSCQEFADALRVALGLAAYETHPEAGDGQAADGERLTAAAVPAPSPGPSLAEADTRSLAPRPQASRSDGSPEQASGQATEPSPKPLPAELAFTPHPAATRPPTAGVARRWGRPGMLASGAAVLVLVAGVLLAQRAGLFSGSGTNNPQPARGVKTSTAPKASSQANVKPSTAPRTSPPQTKPQTKPPGRGFVPRLLATLSAPSGQPLSSVAFSPDGNIIATGDQNGHTYLWDASSRRLIATLTGSPGVYVEVAFSPDGKTIVTGDANGSADLWNTSSHRLITTLTDPSGLLAVVAFSPDGDVIAVGDSYGPTYLWDASSHSLIATLTDPSGLQVLSVAFSPDGRTIATGEKRGPFTYLWDASSHSLIATLTDPSGEQTDSVAFSPDGKMIAIGDYSGSTYLWNASSHRLIATLTDPSSQGVSSVAFSPDGTTIAAGDENGKIYLWNASSHRLIATLTDPSSQGVSSVAFSPDGTTIAAGDANGRTYLWQIG